MKRALGIAPLILFFHLASYGADQSHLAYDIPEPEGWEVRMGLMGTDIIILSAQEGPEDTFRENINVVSEPAAIAGSLKRYVDLNLESMKNQLQGFVVIGRDPLEINGESGEKITYGMEMNGIKFHNDLYIFYKNGTGYNITLSMVDGESRQSWVDKLGAIAMGFKFK